MTDVNAIILAYDVYLKKLEKATINDALPLKADQPDAIAKLKSF